MLVYTKPKDCTLCGDLLEDGPTQVEDKVYGVAGKWNLRRCRNQQCATLFLDHDLSESELATFYQGYSTHASPVLEAKGLKRLYRLSLKHILHRRLNYPTMQHGLPAVLGTILDKIAYFREEACSRVFWLPYKSEGKVIEVGFGNAQGMAMLREAGWDVRGLEFDPVCLDNARDLGFQVVQGNLSDGKFASNSIDAIVASHAIEHLPDPMEFVTEARRILRPGGHLVLRTPNAVSYFALRAGSDWRGLEVPRHLTIYSPQSLAALARKAGFQDVEVFGTPLGGFISQQSVELRKNLKPSSRQGRKTLWFNLLESLKSTFDNSSCEEIVVVAK